MQRPLQPTVRQLPPIRQLLAGAAIAGAIAVAAPAAATAAPSTCQYNPSNKNLIVNDASGMQTLRIVRLPGGQIRIADGSEAPRFCPIPGAFDVASVTNTEKIAIFRSGGAENLGGGIQIDQTGGFLGPGVSPETDGQPEVEVSIVQSGVPFLHNNTLAVKGTATHDDIQVTTGGDVKLNLDGDVDVDVTALPEDITVDGGAGDDIIRSTGVGQSSSMTIFLNGGPGGDIVTGGPDREDLRGGAGEDRLYSVDGQQEFVSGDDALIPFDEQGQDDFAIVDAVDVRHRLERHFVSSGGIGRLKLDAPAHATGTAKLRMTWWHPKAWKSLKSIKARVFHGTKQVGVVTIRPADGRVAAKGIARASKTGHVGKAVTGRLALRLPESLAGETLSVDVSATDAKGRTQVEPAAALIGVTS